MSTAQTLVEAELRVLPAGRSGGRAAGRARAVACGPPRREQPPVSIALERDRRRPRRTRSAPGSAATLLADDAHLGQTPARRCLSSASRDARKPLEARLHLFERRMERRRRSASCRSSMAATSAMSPLEAARELRQRLRAQVVVAHFERAEAGRRSGLCSAPVRELRQEVIGRGRARRSRRAPP